jgi:predicted HAD superfamily Cof-like phosphohydrolase
MTPEQKSVLEFHKAFGLTINTSPTCPIPADRLLREKLILEELRELTEAATIVDVADALGDLLYVVLGAAVTYGIDLEPVFKEIHRSNMTKLWNGIEVKKNADGKVIKPPTYSLANVKAEILRQAGKK